MKQEEKEEIRRQIHNEIATLQKSITTLNELINSEVQSDANDWFSSKESNPSKEINELALEKARRRITLLGDVLKRIDSDGFGICIKCKKTIPFERMKAVPAATRCITCQ
jgi:RNA polymerase-binding transcription factor DksA